MVTRNSDRLLLGVFDTSSAVGVYDVAFMLSQFIIFFGPVLNYFFQPIMSEYDAENDSQRMDKLYKIITRWLVILTFPLFTLLVLFPETLLGAFFGAEYRDGGFVLMLLAIGFYAARFVGLSGSFLTATGDTKVLMYISGLTAALNFGLNILLIPVFGIRGAAITTVSSTVLNNSIQSVYIYTSSGIHPFTKELLLPVIMSLAFLGVTESVISGNAMTVFQALFVSCILGSILVISIILTKSVYLVELKLIDSLLNKVGVDLQIQDKLRVITTD
jgi:O-antigen/teichoic acid export membrane protein